MKVRSIILAVLASAVSFLMLTCQLPLGTSLKEEVGQSRTIFDGANNSGSTDFFFLPPMVGEPTSSTGIFDANLSPTVDIRLLGAETPIATFTMYTGPGSETVRVVPDEEQYIVNWHTGDFALTAGTTYRVSVLLGGCTLGFADVLVAASGDQLRLAATGEVVPLLDGKTLPIKFRIEEGALTLVGPSGGTVSAMDGQVCFDFPAEAVSSETPIVVAPLLDYPQGSSDYIVAQTVFDFGPDGISFGVPITVAIGYNEGLILEGLTEQSLSLVKLLNGVWTQVPHCKVDTVANTVSGALDGFSTYAVAAIPGLFMVGTWDYMETGEHWPCDRVVVSDNTHLQLWYFVKWADGSGFWYAGPKAEYTLYDVIKSGNDYWYRYTMTTLELNGSSNFYWFINDVYTDAQGSYMRFRWRMKVDDPTYPQGFPPDFSVEDGSYEHATFRFEPNPL
jgi:hypothetical protein